METAQRIIDRGYTMNFSKYMEEGTEIWKKEIGKYAGFAALYFLALSVSIFIPFGNLIVDPAFTAGFAIGAHLIFIHGRCEFKDFFQGFETHLGQLILAYLVMGVISAAAMMPLIIAASVSGVFEPEDLSTPLLIAGLAGLGILIYLFVSWHWTLLFIVFHRMKFWEAMESSRRVVAQNWLPTFLLTLLIIVLSLVGILGFFVGMLFTLPLAMCINYAAFADITRLNSTTEEEDLSMHLVD